MNILVIRNDKIGDFMLAWPAFALLKQHFPQSRVTALVPNYTRSLAEICPWLDDIIIDDNHTSPFADAKRLASLFKAQKFDAGVLLFSDFRTAMALWLARIPVRVAPATKLAQIFINHKLVQRRSQSLKPESDYNNDLVNHLAGIYGRQPLKTPEPPYLVLDTTEIKNIRQNYCEQNGISSDNKLVIVHPGHGGSAANLSVEQYAELIKRTASPSTHFIITAGPGESGIAEELSGLLINLRHTLYQSSEGLVAFAKFISACDLFISGSTGPLHIAGVLNKATAAFYPSRRSATSLRWQTCNQDNRRLAFSPEDISGNMDSVNLGKAADAIKKLITKI